MHPLAISLVLLSAAMHALRNFFNKKALDKQAFVWWYEVFGLLFFTIERMSYIVGLRQLSIVFAVLLGGHVLKEKNKLSGSPHQLLFSQAPI